MTKPLRHSSPTPVSSFLLAHLLRPPPGARNDRGPASLNDPLTDLLRSPTRTGDHYGPALFDDPLTDLLRSLTRTRDHHSSAPNPARTRASPTAPSGTRAAARTDRFDFNAGPQTTPPAGGVVAATPTWIATTTSGAASSAALCRNSGDPKSQTQAK